jgi:hypothetical protein
MSRDTAQVLPFRWKDFLREVDQLLGVAVEMHCLGGFVLSALYDLPRPTGDVDYIAAMPSNSITELESIAGQGSALNQKHGLYLQYVTVADVPEDYAERLEKLFPRRVHTASSLCTGSARSCSRQVGPEQPS